MCKYLCRFELGERSGLEMYIWECLAARCSEPCNYIIMPLVNNFSILDKWVRYNTQRLGRGRRPKKGDYERAINREKAGIWCHRSQSKDMFQEGCRNDTMESCWEIEDESREFFIQFGKEEVVDNFDKSCFSGVVAMKICLEWFQRQERVTVNNFNFMVKGCQTWDSSFKLM